MGSVQEIGNTKRLVLIVSYPKSGNTWMRALLTKYLSAGEDLDINKLRVGLVATNVQLLTELLGPRRTGPSLGELDELRPDAYRALCKRGTGLWFLKVHEKWRLTEGGRPVFPGDLLKAVIYVVRNPLDVCVSAAHHFGYSIEKSCLGMSDENFTIYSPLPSKGLERVIPVPAALPQKIGCWSTHVRSWLKSPEFIAHLVRYEDLLTNPGHQFRRVLEKLDCVVDEDRIKIAVNACRFEQLQAQERANGFVERVRSATAPFFRRGVSGTWREELSEEACAAIVAVHGDVMRDIGYLI